MGELLRKTLRAEPASRTRAEIETIAEGAATMQEQHARDVLSMAESARRVKRSDPRVQRARELLERLR